jgi:hypothetical protein
MEAQVITPWLFYALCALIVSFAAQSHMRWYYDRKPLVKEYILAGLVWVALIFVPVLNMSVAIVCILFLVGWYLAILMECDFMNRRIGEKK